MCGLFGWQLQPKCLARWQRQFVVALLASNMDDRGGHSWGIYRPKHNTITKGLGSILKAVFETDLAESHAFMAHTRFATTGRVTLENAHPFRIGGIIGAHNGMVGNHAQLNRLHGRNCAVDSMHIFHHLVERQSLSEIEAYGTIQYAHEDQRNRIYLATFDGEICVAQGDFGVIWASTPDTIFECLELAKIHDWEEMLIKDRQLYFIEDGQLRVTETVMEFAPYARLRSAEDQNLSGRTKTIANDWPMTRWYDENGYAVDDLPAVCEADDEWVEWWESLSDEQLDRMWQRDAVWEG